MKMRIRQCLWSMGLAVTMLAASASPAAERTLIIISDLHLGVGSASTLLAPGETRCPSASRREWNRREDFRWSADLRQFLKFLSTKFGDNTDLVIAGDFLELWQWPAAHPCATDDPDVGCKVADVARLARTIACEHRQDFAAIDDFAHRGANRVFIVPGNHDAALLTNAVWREIRTRFRPRGDRVVLVSDGVWSSPDGTVVVEHGHQIAPDVNLYEHWPIVTQGQRMVRPWGEWFVQQIYSSEEDTYPIIDNVVESSAGVKYRMKDRGFFKSAADFARFARFAVLGTSPKQRRTSLSTSAGESTEPEWDVPYARQRGYMLFVDALEAHDPVRTALTGEPDAGTLARRSALEASIGTMDEAEIRAICDVIAMRVENGARDAKLCSQSTLQYAAAENVVPRRYTLRKHLAERLTRFPKLELFVYGHTHVREDVWEISVDRSHTVNVANPGAFHRVITDEQFRAVAAARKITPEDALSILNVEDLPPCYGVVVVRYSSSGPRAETMSWQATTPKRSSLVKSCSESITSTR